MKTIGILTAHREVLRVDNPQYKSFFQALQLQGYQAIALETIDEDTLQNYRSLLLGVPQIKLSIEERDLLWAWMSKGGRLWCLTSAHHDELQSHRVLEDLCPGLVFQDVPFFASEDEPEKTRAFFRGLRLFESVGNPKLEDELLELSGQCAWLSIGELVGFASTLEYSSGASFSYRGDLPIKNTLASPDKAQYAFAELAVGEGACFVFAGARSFRELVFDDESLHLLLWLCQRWLPDFVTDELSTRRQRPQRHRLLHGYPMLPLMRPYVRGRKSYKPLQTLFAPDPTRGVIIGVLPHPFCNPMVRGCGFCTFPQQSYRSDTSENLVEHVIDEVRAYHNHDPWKVNGRKIHALYFGGGTANLTPPRSMQRLCQTLASSFDTSRAEVTLEGVPIYFIAKRPSLLDVLRELPAQQYRLSMGLQTFDEALLEKMGRLHFGTHQTFQEVVNAAHQRGFAVSADLLFNLPGQSLDAMRQDVLKAIDLGVEQLCLYHLVLFEGLGTEWSMRPEMIQSLPANQRACQNWLILRELLLSKGFVQTTLTNFERKEVNQGRQRFRYEADGFQIEHYDALGFGPSGISFLFDAALRKGLKFTNPEDASQYLQKSPLHPQERFFAFGARDLRVLYLTRRVAALSLRQSSYQRLFGADLSREFAAELHALTSADLLQYKDDTFRLTPTGMFYADSVAGLLAARQVTFLRIKEAMYQRGSAREWVGHDRDVNGALFQPMG